MTDKDPKKAWCRTCEAVTLCKYRENSLTCADLCCIDCDSIHVTVHEFQEQPDNQTLSDEQIESKWHALQKRRSMQARKILEEERVWQLCPRCKSGKLQIDSNGYYEFMRCQSCRHVPFPWPLSLVSPKAK